MFKLQTHNQAEQTTSMGWYSLMSGNPVPWRPKYAMCLHGSPLDCDAAGIVFFLKEELSYVRGLCEAEQNGHASNS